MFDTPLHFFAATVQIEQPSTSGGRTVGTGFLVSTLTPEGAPRVVLVTAHHVLAGMSETEARIGYRSTLPNGSWRYTPETLPIRDAAGIPLWIRHPTQDIAVMHISAPPEHARAAIPRNYLLGAGPAGDGRSLAPGDELMVLGFPRGFAANAAGFPILRAGRIASYPLAPRSSPTFLVDLSVFPGNSGGPVFATPGLRRSSGGPASTFVAGVLTQHVQLDKEGLQIGVVTHALHVAETIDLATGAAVPPPGRTAAPVPGMQPASQSASGPGFWKRPVAALRDSAWRIRKAAARTLQRFSERMVAWLEPSTAPSATRSA